MKEIIIVVIIIVFTFLYIGCTTINSEFPYIHIEYPVRGLLAIIFTFILVWILANVNL